MGIKQIYLTSDKKFEGISNLRLLEIQYLDFEIDLTPYEFLIFTSKNGVIAINNVSNDWQSKKCIAISKQTAKQIEKLGGTCYFVGTNGHGNEFASEILNIVKNSKSLYVRPKEVANNLDEIFRSNKIDYDFVIAYETSCNQNLNEQTFSKNSIFIFTSPKTVNCFFDKFVWDDSFFAICIGQTTQKALPKNIKCKTSNEQTFEACVALAKEI